MKRILQGQPIRQPLHVLLVHLPIGLLVLGFIVECVNLPKAGGVETSGTLARLSLYLIGVGLIGMIVASIPGLVDYASIRGDSPSKRTGRMHLWCNAISFGLFVLVFFLKYNSPDKMGGPLIPFFLSVFGIGFLAYAGFLGGKMVYEEGVGVGRHRRNGYTPPNTIKPVRREDGYVVVAKAGDLADRQTLRVDINGTIIAVAYVNNEYYAFQEFCTHCFGPLSEGSFDAGKVICPWHRSEFDMRTGRVVHGPAKMDLKTFEITVRDGLVLVRAPREPRTPSEMRPGVILETQWKTPDEKRQLHPSAVVQPNKTVQ